VMSTGGLTALVAKKFRLNTSTDERGSFDSRSDKNPNTKSHTHGKEQL
jgi:uncharacterized protein YoaH (UPF0181 family)